MPRLKNPRTWTIRYEPGELVGAVKLTAAAVTGGRDEFIKTLDHELDGLRSDFIAHYDEEHDEEHG